MSEKRKVGRPPLEKTINPEWKQIILEAGQQGKHITDFLITLGISWEGHYSLMKRNQEYNVAVQDYEKLCENYWYNMARTSMSKDGGQGFNARLWSLIVRNKFPKHWSETTKVDMTSQGQKIGGEPVQIEIIRQKTKDDE